MDEAKIESRPFNPYDPLEDRQARYDEIVAMVAEKKSYREIGRRYGISPARVGQIVKGGPPGLAGWAGNRARSEA